MKNSVPLRGEGVGWADTPRDIDGWLRLWFQSELPRPWPAPPALPEQRPTRTRRFGSPLSSRWALAASLLLLLGGYGWLTQHYPEPLVVPLSPWWRRRIAGAFTFPGVE